MRLNYRIIILGFPFANCLNIFQIKYEIKYVNRTRLITAKNTAISPNFLVWKFFRPKLCGNCAFPQNFYTRKLGEITVFFAVDIKRKWKNNDNINQINKYKLDIFFTIFSHNSTYRKHFLFPKILSNTFSKILLTSFVHMLQKSTFYGCFSVPSRQFAHILFRCIIFIITNICWTLQFSNSKKFE